MRSKSATTPPISSFGPAADVPSHYEFLLITQEVGFSASENENFVFVHVRHWSVSFAL